jgi:hypothetical protein
LKTTNDLQLILKKLIESFSGRRSYGRVTRSLPGAFRLLSELQTLSRLFGTWNKRILSLTQPEQAYIVSELVDQMDGEGDPSPELSRLVLELQTLRENFFALQSGELPQYRIFVDFLEND